MDGLNVGIIELGCSPLSLEELLKETNLLMVG